jgi:uncharacterized C2H2 Zn-finger protein
MAFKCGNCGKEHLTRKEWIKHLIDEHNTVFYEGDEKDIALCKSYLDEKIAKGDSKAKDMMEKY